MSVNETTEPPIFPLGTVLFPGGPLPLRLFEPRYLDMVSDCLRREHPFGVCLIRSGSEVGEPAEPHRIGTLAHIVDRGHDGRGILTVEAIGETRFRIIETRTAENEFAPVGTQPWITPARTTSNALAQRR